MANAKLEEFHESASELLDEGDADKALVIIEKALKISPFDADSLMLKAEALVQSNREDEALQTVELAVQKHPDDPTILLYFAGYVVDLQIEDPAMIDLASDRVISGLELAEKAGDDDILGELWRVQGRLHTMSGDLHKSVAAFEKALELQQKSEGDVSEDLRVELAMSYFEASRFADSQLQLDMIIEDMVDDPRVPHFQGLLAERAGLTDKATELFKRASELAPNEFPVRPALPKEEFARILQMAIAALPPEIAKDLNNVPVTIADLPSDHELKTVVMNGAPMSPLSLGIFEGFSPAFGLIPQESKKLIKLFQRNVERYAHSNDDILEFLEITFLNEIGAAAEWSENTKSRSELN